MNRRVGLHIGFWLAYLLLYTYLSGRYDLRFGVAFIGEIAQLPAKISANYLIFKWLEMMQGQVERLLWRSIGVILAAAFVNRLVMYFFLYPAFYKQHYTMQFWDVDRILFTIIDVGTAVGVATALKLARYRVASRSREQQLLQEKLQSELQFLRAQTNPHFLFNTLNNIYAVARRESPQAAELLMRLSKLLRFMLYECSKPTIPLADEVKIIRDLIELEKLRYGNRLEVEFVENIDDPDQPIAPLLLLPFVENAFKHGASENRFLTNIYICLQLQNEYLLFIIKNDKEAGDLVNNEGLGLQNVRRQLELLYANKFALDIENEHNTFKAILKLKLENL
ncbi:MAG: sensor histidine kinase [Saprospiraceae bacterium]